MGGVGVLPLSLVAAAPTATRPAATAPGMPIPAKPAPSAPVCPVAAPLACDPAEDAAGVGLTVDGLAPCDWDDVVLCAKSAVDATTEDRKTNRLNLLHI